MTSQSVLQTIAMHMTMKTMKPDNEIWLITRI